MSFVAPSTAAGFMWFIEPRSSAAPYLEGQRSDGAGGVHEGCCACAAVLAANVAIKANRSVRRFIDVLLSPKPGSVPDL